MRLREKDKEWMRQEISKAVVDALSVEMHWEKVRDEETGVPLAAPKLIKENVFLPAFFCQHLKFHEGAFRGQQEDTNKAVNSMNEALGKIDIVGNTLLSMQESVMTMAKFAVALKETGVLEQLEKALEIEYTGPKAIENEADTG